MCILYKIHGHITYSITAVVQYYDNHKGLNSGLNFIQHKNPCTTSFTNMGTAEINMGCDVIINIFDQNIKSLIARIIIQIVLQIE